MSKRDPGLLLEDITAAIEKIERYVAGIAFDRFTADDKTIDAVVRNLEIIGEAVGKLSDELKIKYPNVEWQDIKDFRNLLTHEYFGVDLEIVWKIVQDDLPALMDAVREILRPESE